MQNIFSELQATIALMRIVSPLIIGLFTWYLWTLKQKFVSKKEFYSFKDDYVQRQHTQDLVREQNSKDITYIKENIVEIKDTLKRKF